MSLTPWYAGAWVLNALRKFIAPAFTGGVPIIKSVQRGNTSGTSVTISEVNPDKCIVLVNNMYASIGGAVMTAVAEGNDVEVSHLPQMARPTALTATKLTLSNNVSYSVTKTPTGRFDDWTAETGTVSWQVIEYY